MKKIFALLLISLFLVSCEKEKDNDQVDSAELFLLNQGSWGGNNADITYVDNDGMVHQNHFSEINGKEMGDSGNGIIIVDEKIFVLLSGSKMISVLDKEGQLVKNIELNDYEWPYQFCYSNGKIYVTDLYLDKVGIINAVSMELESQTLTTGPGPEGVSAANGKIYVANSGVGELRDTVEGSRTVWVFDDNTYEKIGELEVGPNTRFVHTNGNSVWVGYTNFWGASDVGGIKKFNATTLNLETEWKVDVQSNLKMINGEIYYISNQGLNKLTPNAYELVFEKTNLSDFWTNLEYDSFNEEILLMNARDYQVAGEVIVVKDGLQRTTIPTGLVPYGAIVITD